MNFPLLPSLAFLAVFLFSHSATSAESPPVSSHHSGSPSLHLFQSGRIQALKEAYQNRTSPEVSKPTLEKALHIIAEADKVLHHKDFTITGNVGKLKINTAMSDLHDYFSIAPYYWPNPSTPDGFPYIRKDGERNPRKQQVSDQAELSRLINAVINISLAYRITGKEEYAASAARFLRAFFIDPSTRMNPNLNYAQAILGVNGGRGGGIIDSEALTQLPDAVTLLSKSSCLEPGDRKGMRSWFSDFANWMQTSKNGQDESRTKNNHGFYYDLELSTMLLGAGKENEARALLQQSLPKRMDSQIRPDGQMPLEEARRTSWHYCSFNLRAICRAGLVAQSLGISIWDNQAQDGSGSLKKAMLFLIPFIDHRELWKFSEISDFSSDKCRKWLAIGSVVYDDPIIRKAQQTYAPIDSLSIGDWLIVPTQRTPREIP
jgi:hypothetical protein